MTAAQGGGSLAAQTARTLAIAFGVFIVIAVAGIIWFMVVPMARRSAEDLAALMMLSAQTWTELPPQTRSAFEDELVREHNLWLQADVSTPLPVHAHYYPYMSFLEEALSRHSGRAIHIKITNWEENWFWVELPVGKRIIRVGFPQSRIQVQPPLAGLVVLLAGIALSLLTARLLAILQGIAPILHAHVGHDQPESAAFHFHIAAQGHDDATWCDPGTVIGVADEMRQDGALALYHGGLCAVRMRVESEHRRTAAPCVYPWPALAARPFALPLAQAPPAMVRQPPGLA